MKRRHSCCNFPPNLKPTLGIIKPSLLNELINFVENYRPHHFSDATTSYRMRVLSIHQDYHQIWSNYRRLKRKQYPVSRKLRIKHRPIRQMSKSRLSKPKNVAYGSQAQSLLTKPLSEKRNLQSYKITTDTSEINSSRLVSTSFYFYQPKVTINILL